MKTFPVFLLLAIAASWANAQYNVRREDPFAALSATLQTYQEAACDGQTLSLECPEGTKIAIQFVQYGRAAPSEQVRRRPSWLHNNTLDRIVYIIVKCVQ